MRSNNDNEHFDCFNSSTELNAPVYASIHKRTVNMCHRCYLVASAVK